MRAKSSPGRRTTGARGTAVGARLTFETLAPLGERPACARLSPGADVLLRVVSGTVSLTTDAERLLGPGDEAIVPAGATYRLAGADGEAVVVTGLRGR